MRGSRAAGGWLVEFADKGETSTSPGATEYATQTRTRLTAWKMQCAYANMSV